MAKISAKLAFPIILAGFFVIIIFMAVDYQQIDAKIYVILALLTIYVFFFGFATGQRFASPVKKLLQRAEDLSKGNLSSRLYLETKDEFGDLARAFNKIAEAMENSQTKMESTEKSVDIKVRARTQEMEETINALEQKVKNRTIELDRLVDESEKLQQLAKNREAEVMQLKTEINSLKLKVGKYIKPRKTEQ